MEDFMAYHVVTDHPMRVGQRIRFDGEHHSGVYRRVMEKREAVREIYAHPETYKAALLEHHTAVALRELALEEVRQAAYPAYPSRLACLYVSETLEDAEKWSGLFAEWGRPTYHIVRLRIQGNRFAGNANLCFAATPDKQRNLALARRYWENAPYLGGEPPIKEILVNGDIDVMEIMREINRNV